jgi:hypothetical protein
LGSIVGFAEVSIAVEPDILTDALFNPQPLLV